MNAATFDFMPMVSGRRPCSTCGMIANVDPDEHCERYAHLPTIVANGDTYRYDIRQATFVKVAA